MHAPIYTGDGSRGGADTHIHQCIAQVVAAEVVQTGKDVLRLVTCTLLNEERGFADVAAAAKTALHKLQDQGFVRCAGWLAGWLGQLVHFVARLELFALCLSFYFVGLVERLYWSVWWAGGLFFSWLVGWCNG